MWFRRVRHEAESPPCAGKPGALDGLAAACAVETLACQALLIQSDAGFTEITGPLRKLLPADTAAPSASIHHLAERARLPGLAVGLTATGLRTATMLSALTDIREALQAIAGKRLACVIHLCGRASRRQAGALHGGHDDYYAIADAGLCQLFASNVQEVADFALIAHRIAELSLTPVLYAQDLYGTAQSVQTLTVPQRDLVDAFLGRADDRISCPTPAQQVLFGEQRRRIPRLIDPDRPVGVGGVQDRDSFMPAVAAQRPFFAGHIDSIVTTAMDEFARLTGRHYDKVAAYRSDDADVVVLAMGAVVEKLASVVDYLRDQEGIKVGLLNLTLWRPFPGGHLTHLIKGKRALTVLERGDAPLADDNPVLRELRGAIDRAHENGAAGKDRSAWPGFATYRQARDRPQLYGGVYGIGAEIPSFAALCAVVRNMTPNGAQRRRFYVGVRFERDSHGLPLLEMLQQKLYKSYPDLRELSLPETPLPSEPTPDAALELHALALQGGLFAGNLFARALHAALGEPVRTFPRGGLEPTLQPSRFTLVHGADDCRSCPSRSATVLVAGDGLLETLRDDSVSEGGTLVVATSEAPSSLWGNLSRRTAHWIRERGIRFVALDARRIAMDAAAQISFVEQLEVWALLGASMTTGQGSSTLAEQCDGELRRLLTELYGERDPIVDAITGCVRRGREDAAEFDWLSLPSDERRPAAEREAPWTVRPPAMGHGTLHDPGRFWQSVGLLYDSGRADDTLVDPFLATGVIPAGSSAHRDMRPYRLRLPRWLAENCSGCGLCWSLCPDSALPATVQSVQNVVDTAISACRADGAAMTQMGRIAEPLARQAQRIAAQDDLRQYRRAGALLAEAFGQLTGKMDLNDVTRSALSADLERLGKQLGDWPIARTAAFFDAVEAEHKGRGRLLSIALNPSSCKACGLCIEACPEAAFEWTENTAQRIASDRHSWAFQAKMPEVPDEVIAAGITASDPGGEVNRLLDRHVYHSMVGGDGAFPGNGPKTAVHLITAAVESVMQARFAAHARHLKELIEGLRSKIQGDVAGVVQINDFEDFAARLSRLDVAELTPKMLASVFDSDEVPRRIDQAELSRLTRLLAELEAQQRCYADPESGRARLILAFEQGDAVLWSGTYPDNPHASPWLSHTRGDGAALAEGLMQGIVTRCCEELAACRLAELALQGRCRPEDHEQLRRHLRWETLTLEERALIPPILLVGQSEFTGWREVARALDAAWPLHVAILDTDGIGIRTDGERSARENCTLLAMERGNAFVLQSSIGNPGHLIRGVTRSLAGKRAALFHIMAPDPQANGIAPEKIAEQARGAYESRAVPLFLFDPDAEGATLSLAGNPEPGAAWAHREWTAREPAGEQTFTTPLTVADWAIHEARFRAHFNIIARGHSGEAMRSLAEFIALGPGKRSGLTPYIEITDEAQRRCIATVSPAMVAATEQCFMTWAWLRERAAGQVIQTDTAAAMVPPPPSSAGAPPVTPDAGTHEQLKANLLQLCGYTSDPDWFRKSLRDFLSQRAHTHDTPRAHERSE